MDWNTQVAYTYSKCMTDSSGYYGSWGGQTTPTSPYWQNLYDKKAEWGPCYYDATHVLTSYATYDFPVGRGRTFGNDMNKVADAFVGGWQVNGILEPPHRLPADHFRPGCLRHQLPRCSRADCLAPPDVFGEAEFALRRLSVVRSGFLWPAAPGTFGTCGVGTVRGPGLHTVRSQCDEVLQLHRTSEAGVPQRVHQPDEHADSELT